jgi:hypothetical protein
MRKKGRQITTVKPQREYREGSVIDRLGEKNAEVSGTRGSDSDRHIGLFRIVERGYQSSGRT